MKLKKYESNLTQTNSVKFDEINRPAKASEAIKFRSCNLACRLRNKQASRSEFVLGL